MSFKLKKFEVQWMMTQNSQVCSLSLESQQQHVQRLNYRMFPKIGGPEQLPVICVVPSRVFDIKGLVEAAVVLAGTKCETQRRLLLDHH